MANGLYAAIAQGGTPIQIENPLNQMAKIAAIRNDQQEQQLNALKMQEAQTSAQALGGQASNLGANLGQTYMTGGIGAGQARASGYLGQSSALTGALGTGLNYFQNQQLMDLYRNRMGQQMPAEIIDRSIPYLG